MDGWIVEIGSLSQALVASRPMETEAGDITEEDELVIALTPAQLAAVLAVLVVIFVLIRARRAR